MGDASCVLDKQRDACYAVHTRLNFVEPLEVILADGCPPHPRLPGANVFDKTRAAGVYVYDAACRGDPQLEKHGFEFVVNGFRHPSLKQLLNEACSWEVLLQDLSSQPEYHKDTRHGSHSDGNRIVSQTAGLKAVEDHLASRGIGISRSLVKALAKALSWNIVKLRTGWLLVLYCVPVGILRRTVYPKNGHPQHTGAGAGVHADQDITGDPLKGKGVLLRWLLERQWVRVLNLWLPVGNMAARPLCLMDVQTLESKDKVRHRWLDHDGWFFLHNPLQTWWWHSSLGHTDGDVVIFDTLRTPHAAFALPGEDFCHALREKLYSGFLSNNAGENTLDLLSDALQQIKVSIPLPEDWPQPVHHAIGSVQMELETLLNSNSSSCMDQSLVKTVICRSLGHLQRQSIEARAVALGPFTFERIVGAVGMACLVIMAFQRTFTAALS